MKAYGAIKQVQLHAMDCPACGRRFRLFALCLLACLAILEFSLRGPVRALGRDGQNFNDFVSPYEQTHAWISGRDPYAPAVLTALWPTSVRPHFVVTESVDGTLPAKRGIPSPYWTLSFPLLLPVAEFPWKVAIWLWTITSVVATFVVALILVPLSGARPYSPLAIIIVVSVFLWAPLQTAIATSNIFTVAFALGMGATFCLTQGRSRLAGMLLICTIALKPTVGLPFLIYILFQPKRTTLIPFGPFLLLATFIIVIYGTTITDWLYRTLLI